MKNHEWKKNILTPSYRKIFKKGYSKNLEKTHRYKRNIKINSNGHLFRFKGKTMKKNSVQNITSKKYSVHLESREGVGSAKRKIKQRKRDWWLCYLARTTIKKSSLTTIIRDRITKNNTNFTEWNTYWKSTKKRNGKAKDSFFS